MNASISVPTNQSYYALALPGLQLVYKQLCFWVTIFVFVPGVVANSFMAYVFGRRRFRTSNQPSLVYYNLVYVLLCNLTLAMGIVNFFPTAFGVDLTLASSTSCKMVWFLRIIFLTCAEGFQAQMSVDRALHVIYPHRFNISKMTNLVGVTCIICLTITVYSAAFEPLRYLIYKNAPGPNNTIVLKAVLCTLSPTVTIVHNFILFVVRFTIILVILIGNMVMFCKLVRSKKNLNKDFAMSSKEYSFAISLVVVNVIKCVMIAPHLVLLLWQLRNGFYPSLSTDYTGYVNVIYSFTNLANYGYHALPFFVMLLSNKMFRKELFRVFVAICLMLSLMKHKHEMWRTSIAINQLP